MRVIASFLVVVMLLSSVLTTSALASRVTIRSSDEPAAAAVNYLVQNTEYVNENKFQRMASWMGTRGLLNTLQDYYSLAGTHIARERYDLALINIDKCIELYGNEGEELLIDLWLKKGCLCVMLEEYDEAIAALDQVLSLDASTAEVYLIKAQVFAGLSLYADMCASLESYLALVPDDREVASLLAQLRTELEESVAVPVTASNPPRPAGESEYLKGLYAMQDGEYELAENALSQAIALNSTYEGVHYYRGVCRLSLEDYSGAAADFASSIENACMVHSSYYNRGISLIMADEYEDGLADILYAAELDEDPSIKSRAENFLVQVEEAQAEAQLAQFLSLAQLCAELDDLAGMCENLEEYLKEVPEDISIRTALAQAYFAHEEYGKALTQYAVILTAGESAEVEYLYGLTALQMSDFALAQEALSRAIALADSCVGVYYYRGVCRLSLEDYQGAAADFTASIQAEDMVHSSFFNRGISYLMLEDYEAGVQDIQTAADMDEDPEVKQQAKQLLKDI
jgi:tetratricopeptide (TPR) repeat protein